MAICCDSSTPDTLPASATLTVALAGNPNSGKTTIFNALTGLRQKVANYPGVTVEKKTGRCKLPGGRWVNVIDLPGTYSLISRSPDEHISMEVLRGLRPDTPAPDVVVVVVDASNLQRNLYLVSQLIELGKPLVVALNMMDVAERRGIRVDVPGLSERLGTPVIPVVGHRRKGIDELKQAIAHARVAPMPAWPLPEAMKEELLLVGGGLAILDSAEPSAEPGQLGQAAEPKAWICSDDSVRRLDRYHALAERLLIGDRAADIAPLASREPVASLLQSSTSRLMGLGIDPMQADVEAHYRWIEGVSTSVAQASASALPLDYEPASRTLTDSVDAVLIHKVWGLVIFAMIMAGLFVTIFFMADPIMGAVEGGVATVGAWIAAALPDGPIRDLIKDGIFAGVGAVVVFVPQIALLFLFLAIMEDSGYLARAAFLMDRVLSKVGLHGKSFIPLLSSFACAIPGIMATRTIEDRKSRLATIFVAPFMSCSARLPVYLLLIGTFFAMYGSMVKGMILLALYLTGIIAAVVTALLFKATLTRGPKPAFILELPTYKVPQLSQIVRQVWANTWAFLAKAGTIIFCLSVILWAMTYYPRLPAGTRSAIVAELDGEPITLWDSARYDSVEPPTREEVITEAIASEQLRYSFAGRFGRLIEPAIRPLGYDWKMGVGLVGAFAAREVFVSTMAIVYNAGGEDETEPLSQAMLGDTYADGSKVWTPLIAASLLVWFVLAMQCMSTLAIVKRETNTWRWPMLMLIYMNGLAYVVCLVIYQVGSRVVS
jgi:ferrous iron transport protein B